MTEETKPAIQQILERVHEVNRRAGFLSWDPDKIALDPHGDPGPEQPRLPPPTPESPRLFLSYSWSRDETHGSYESDVWVDAFTGFLFNRGYDIFFDRDPRNFAKGLNWVQVLTRMNDCSYFVPILTDEYLARVSSPQGVGPLVAEWKHAQKLFPSFLAFIGIRRSRSELPAPFTGANTVDARDAAPWAETIAAMFPSAPAGKRGVPVLPPPARPPDPAHWPKFHPR